jgi:hypothetical protein
VNPDGFNNAWVRRLAFDPAQDGQWAHLYIEVPDTSDGLIEVLVGETNSQSNAAVSTALAFIQATAGGVIPPHYHPGAGTQSVAVGTGASAAGQWSVALGVDADASDDYNVAVGYDAQAQGLLSFALGASARANVSESQAIGYGAVASGINSLALGYLSEAAAADTSAIGHTARALAAQSTAVGADALADGTNSLAIGAAATASGSDSVALGAGATVTAGHAGGVAIGRSAATTAGSQIALGTAQHLVLVQGDWRNLGDTLIGSASSRLGFFGSAGTIKQEVSGSRDGNVALAALLTALDDLGIITDSSTA